MICLPLRVFAQICGVVSSALLCASAGLAQASIVSPLTTPVGHSPENRAIGENWSELELPANFVGPGTVVALGTLVLFQTPTSIFLWSAITKDWTEVPVSPAATLSQFNAYVVIEDGLNVHAYATRTGRVETLTFPSVPQLHHGSNTSCWVSIATLGNEAWGFGAFDGEWVQQTLATSTPTIKLAQTTGIVHDGVQAFGFSSAHGEFVATSAPGTQSIDVVGDVAVAWTATEAQGFSTHTGTWDSYAMSGGTLLTHQRGYAMFSDGADAIAFSGGTGEFATYTPPVGWGIVAGRYVAGIEAGNVVVGYSCARGLFDERTFAGSVVVAVDDEVMVVTDSAGATGFSLLEGTFSAPVLGNFTPQLKDAMAWIDDGVTGYAYSLIENSWSQAPTLGTQINLLRNVVVITHANGHTAFAGRTGEWAEHVTTAPGLVTAPGSGDVFIGLDGAHVVIFDPVLGRWARAAGHAPLQAFDAWRQTFLGFDGRAVFAYGLMNNVWSTVHIKGVFQNLDANSSSGYVLTDSHVYAYGSHGSLSTLSRFPDFSRYQPIAAPLRLIQTGAVGDTVTAYFGLGAARIDAGLLGTVFLDPNAMIGSLPLGAIPADGILDVALDLSNTPAAHGLRLHVQNLVVNSHGHASLTNCITPILF